jgi:hypothetical protein
MFKKMKPENVMKLSDEQFRRRTGVKRVTFSKMVEVVQKAQDEKSRRGGPKPKLSVVERVLMTLEYLREYRTYLHIGTSYGLCESSTYDTIKWIEEVLIKCGEFSLPGRKALLKTDNEFQVVLIDSTESPIERPKKNNADFTPEKRKNTLSSRRSLSVN